MEGLQLVSVVVCDDVLVNVAGRVTLYSIFRDLFADAYPAGVVRLHVVTTWLNSAHADREVEVVERVAILSPDGVELVADAAATFTIAAGMYHSQISRFRDIVFPEPGTYRVQVQAGPEVVADLPLFLTAETTAETAEEEV